MEDNSKGWKVPTIKEWISHLGKLKLKAIIQKALWNGLEKIYVKREKGLPYSAQSVIPSTNP